MKRYDLLTTTPADVREAFVVMFGGESCAAVYGVDTLEEADACFDSYASDPSHDGELAFLLDAETGALAGMPRLVAYQPSN
jgi:hypothetical protein